MWEKGNKIDQELIHEKNFIYFKFNCGLCSCLTQIEFFDFFFEYFKRKPDFIWETNIKCPHCESNYHDISISTENSDLVIKVESEGGVYPVNQNTVYYSLIETKTKKFIEIPIEYDFIDFIVGNSYFSNYCNAINEIQELLKKREINSENTLLKFIYSSIITIFETYLFDLFINTVNSNPIILRNVVENYKIFNGTKIQITDIFKEYSEIKNKVMKELQKISYHNMNVVIPLFKESLSIDFSKKTIDLNKMINIRHDIVHRNGEDFNGNKHNINLQEISKLIEKTNEIVIFINEEYNKMNY